MKRTLFDIVTLENASGDLPKCCVKNEMKKLPLVLGDGPVSTDIEGKAATLVHRILQDEAIGLELKVAYGDSTSLYADCQEVRSVAGDSVVRHGFDTRSYHFVSYYQDRPVGTMTATRCSDGPVDQEQFYPKDILKAYRNLSFSSCKLRINQYEKRGPGTFRMFIKAAWAYLAGQGLRIDMMNCDVSKRRAYESLGYRCIRDFDFRHSDLSTDSRVMILCADRNHPSMFRPLFQSLDDAIQLDETLAAFQLAIRDPE